MQEEAIRKAAVLVSVLDAGSADALLDKMSDEQASRVRNAVLYLDNVSDAEERAVLAEFFGAGGNSVNPSRRETAVSTPPVERPETAVQPTAAPPDSPRPAPFGFLHDATVETLLRHLKQEHPQVIAVVVGHLHPARAAELIQCYKPKQQAEILRRVARLGEADPETLQDLERELASRISEEHYWSPHWVAGLNTVSSILNAAGTDRDEMLSNLSKFDGILAQRVSGLRASPGQVGHGVSPQQRADYSLAAAAMESERPARNGRSEELGTDAKMLDFTQLMSLADADLALLFANVDPELTLLALAEAPQVLWERIVSRLPARGMRELQIRLEQLGPLRLADIEQAQQAIARTATRLADEGRLAAPSRRRFAAAA